MVKKVNKNSTNNKSRNVKAFFARNILIGLAGIALWFLSLYVNSFLGLLPVAGVMLAFYGFGWAFSQMHDLIDIYFPLKRMVREDTILRMVRYGGTMLLIGAGVFLITEIHDLNFTIGAQQLVIIAAVSGLLFAVVVLFALQYIFKGIYAESTRRYSLLRNVVLSGILLGAATAGYINTSFAMPTEICSTYEVLSRRKTSSSGHLHFISVLLGDVEKEFLVTEDIYIALNVGKPVKLCIKRGVLGYDFVPSVKQ